MYKLIYTEKLRSQIRFFIKNFFNIYVDLYSDIGIEEEYLIIKDYEEKTLKFLNDIYLEMEKIFSEEIIMKKISEKGFFNTSFSVGGFRFFVDYTEDKVEKIRFLENVEIYKK